MAEFSKLSRIREPEEAFAFSRFLTDGSGPNALHVVAPDTAMARVVAHAQAAARTDSLILITGESGTGKDLLARFIHSRSERQDREMVSVNCGAFTESLFESEFFGCEKGSYTGAHATRAGLLEAADGSTLFLDEIGDLAPAMQVKLLRFLEQGTFRRIGATSDRRVNVRVIAATNRNLEREVESGRFRADLYYRLNVIPLEMPPLRERRDEIPELIEYFLSIFRQRLRRPKLTLSLTAEERLRGYSWPGNIRELRNRLEKACVLSKSDIITERELEFAVEDSGVAKTESISEIGSRPAFAIGAQFLSLDLVERGYILTVLAEVQGNRERAALILGISARTLYRKLREYESTTVDLEIGEGQARSRLVLKAVG